MTISKRPVHHSTSTQAKHNSNGDTNVNIWSSILKGVATSRMIHTKNVVVLGDPSSGKSTLIQHLQSESPPSPSRPPTFTQASNNKGETKKHLALGFNYTTVYDEDNEDMARLGIYQLSTPEHMSLLQFVLNMEMIKDTMILIVLDWSQPWTFMAKLQQWIQVIHHTVLGLYKQHSDNKLVMESLCQHVLGYMKQYKEAGTNVNGSISTLTGITAEQVDLPLTEGALSINYGIPLAVVCCKSDKQHMLESTLDYRENRFDYIQQTLRTVCMKYGAALFYTSTLHPQTFTHLRQYILHRTMSATSLYSFEEKAQIMDREIVMVPAGWDTWGKIKALQKEFDCQQVVERWDVDMGALEDRQPVSDHGLQFIFKDIIVDPNEDYQPLVVPSVTICEDEQIVLKRHFDSLQRISGGTSTNLSKLKSSAEPRLLGTIGPSSSSLTSTLDILHATDSPSISSSIPTRINNDLEASTKKLVWDKMNKGSTIPLTTSASDTVANTTAPPFLSENGNNSTSTSNVILSNFFQSLLSKKTPSASSSSSLSSSSTLQQDTLDGESVTSTRTHGLVNRKDVQKHLAQIQQQQQQHSLYS
ncbi:dynein light intermediate chain-domain-containing protein [Chlamydoabsidia padenii]|nr:dynein light intermediate chain-domain-containing protein [Chlamydoabsidia padenii]